MEPGIQIGAYEILRKLGEGGMGAVYEARHTLIGRHAAIKVLLPSYSQDQGVVNRFFNEARAATAVADPGIVQIFDFGYHMDGSAYIVMEYLDGETLEQRLSRVGRLPVADVARIGRQVATALSAAHKRGIVHRDLKPENVFLVLDPEVIGGERAKVLDFGIAKLATDELGRTATRTGAVIGTPEYMSPEQCRGAGSVQIDDRADIYALGCILFALATGRPPFQAEGVGDLIIAHVTQSPPVPSALVPGLPRELDAIVLRCLEKNPSERFQSMTALAQALSDLQSAAMVLPSSPYAQTQAGTGPVPRMTPGPIAKSTGTITGGAAELHTPSPKRRRIIMIASAGIGIAIGMAAIYMIGIGGREEPPAPAPTPVVAPAPVVAPVTPDAAVVAAPAPAPPPDAAPVDAAVATAPVDAAAPVATKPKHVIHHPRETKKTDRKPTCPPNDIYCVE